MSYDLPPEVRVLKVEPGDTVYCQLAHGGERERMAGLAAELKELFPHAHVIVADGDTRMQVVPRGHERSRSADAA